MSAADKPLARAVHQWLELGQEDLRLAEHAFSLASSCPFRLIAYHAQQCAEKRLKAYLVHKRVDFPYTHNIATLLELCEQIGGLPRSLDEAEELSVYAVAARYPSAQEAVTEAEARRERETSPCPR